MITLAGDEKSLLNWAIETRDSRLVHGVFQNPRDDMNIQDNYPRTALILQCDKNILEKLLFLNDICVNCKDDQGMFILISVSVHPGVS